MLGLVSPILNRGVRSRWVSTLPAGSKMLTIDAAGDVSYTDIPTAAWGSITGTLSNQTDLQNALNAKLSLTGGTLTGIGSAGTSTLRVNAGSGSSFTQINDNGTVVIDSDTATGTFPLTLKYAGTTVASVSYQGTITGGIGAFSSLSLDSGFVILDTDATNVLAQRSSTAAQAYRIYNTFTNVSNYERGKIEWSSNVLRIGTEKAGTGSARALELQTDGTTRLTIATNGDVTTASNFSVGNNSIYLGGSGVIRLADYTRIHTPDSYGPIDIAPMTNNVTGVVRVYNTIRSLTNYERLECGQAYNANAFIRTAAGGTGTRRNLEIDAPEIKIAIATTQKIGFYNATPVDQPDTIADPTGGATIDAEARTAINALIDRLQELGLIAT